jgi:Fe-S cluster assembly protein SufD
MLEIKNLYVKLEEEDKVILKGVDLTVEAGKVHAIMGPNGSGKSTLAYVLAGRDGYQVTEGSVTLEGEELLEMEPEERAALGLFLAFQYPVEIPGVGNMTFMRTALNSIRKARGQEEMSSAEFLKVMRAKAKELKIDAEMLKRPVNVGFSGGEKKRNEILQMAMLEPKMCVLDETDSGLDVDAMRLVADGVNALRDAGRGFLVITHYQRLAGSYQTRCRAHHGRRSHRKDGRSGTGAGGRNERLHGHPCRGRSGGMTAKATLGPRAARRAAKLEATAARLEALRLPESGQWLRRAREAALARVQEMGLPDRRDEYWKFTDPTTLVQPEVQAAKLLDVADEPMDFDAFDRLKIVFVDGVFDAGASDDLSGEGLEVVRLAEAGASDIHWAREFYGTLEAEGQTPVPRPLAALNTALATDGVLIRATGKVSRPVSLIYLRRETDAESILHHLVRVEEGAELTLLENGPAAARVSTVTEAWVGDGAALHHVRTQGRDHERRAVTHFFAQLGAQSVFKSFTLTANGALSRNESVVWLNGKGGSAHVAGAAMGDGKFHHDDTVFVTHAAPDCESRQVFKKVLRNGAVGVFQGKILVRQAAQLTDGYQISQALLLDETSQFLAKPELEIYADDVKCSHGSTSGEIDADQLFYLRARGVPEEAAQGLLVLAFLAEAVEEIAHEDLAEEIRRKLGGWVSRHN